MRISDWSSDVCSSDLVSGTFKATTWNLNALYEINRDINVYASVRRGYKSGGFNSTALNPADRFFAPETVTDYEIGLKSQWHLGGWQIRANVDLFYDDYKNIQRFVNQIGRASCRERVCQYG